MIIDMNKTKRLTGDERGFVSLVIALTLIIILALLTVGFAQLSRREQKQALDKHLSVQAYYAAETGVNDAFKAINATDATRIFSCQPVALSGCNPKADDGKQCIDSPLTDLNVTTTKPKNIIDSSANVSYSCVLIDMNPDSLVYTDVAPEVDHNASFTTDLELDDITVAWNSPNLSRLANFPSPATGFIPFAQWNDGTIYKYKWPSLIEFSLTQFDPTATSQSALIGSLFTTYLYPSGSASSAVDYNPSATGSITSATCDKTAQICSATIHIPAPDVHKKYLIHFLPRYNTADVTITGIDRTTGKTVQFIGAQAKIDVTGKAQDVLKRIQVRTPLSKDGPLPRYPIEAQAICKRLATAPAPATTSFSVPDSEGPAASGSACDLSHKD